MWPPTRLSRYFLRELITPTLLGLGLYTFALMMNWAFFVAKDAVAKDLDARTVAGLVVYFLPHALILSIPMGTLLGTLIGVGRLAADHEIVAMQASGVPPTRLVRPVLVHGALATAASALIYLALQPAAADRLEGLKRQLVAVNLASELRPRVFFTGVPGTVVYVDEIPAGSDRLQGILVYQANDGYGYEQLILAREGYLRPSPEEKGTIELDLRDGVTHNFRTSSPETYRPSKFGRYLPKPLRSPAYAIASGSPRPKLVSQMSPAELIAEIRRLEEERDPIIRDIRQRYAWVELHQRIALPIACFLFALLALPLGVERVRSGRAAGFALSLAVVLVYWLAFTTAKEQALRGTVPPALGVWAGNIAVAVWTAGAYYARFGRAPRGKRGFGLLNLALHAGSRLRPLAAAAFRHGAAAPDSLRLEIGSASPAPHGSRPAGFVSLLDRYVSALYLRSLLFALLSAYLIFAIVRVKSLLDSVVEHRRPMVMVLDYLKYFGPGELGTILPVACLLAGVVTLTIVGRNGELTAAKAAGMSAHRLALPILALTGALCVALFFVEDRVSPFTNRKAQEARDRIEGRSARTYGMLPGGRWTFGSGGLLYHYRLYDPATQTFQGLSVYRVDFATPRIVEHRFAEQARWSGSTWTAARGWSRTFPEDLSAGGGYERFETARLEGLDPPDNFARTERLSLVGDDLPEQTPLADLRRQIAWLGGSGYDTTRLRVAFHSRLARPLAPLVMVLLGVPFALFVGRRGSLYGIGVALGLVIVYWAAFAAFTALGAETLLPPLLAAWGANVLFGVVGGSLLLYVRT